MAVEQACQTPGENVSASTSKDSKTEFPAREYIAAMSLELAQMARWEGDEALARLLDAASGLAGEPLVRKPVEVVEPSAVRPS